MKRTKFLLAFTLYFFFAISAIAQKTKSKKPVQKPAQKTQVQKTRKPTTQTTTKTTPAARPKESINIVEDEKRVRDIVAFLQFMLNTLGNSSTSARDKDVLITESYAKIFRDGKVQIEDDLDEERIVITNKDIVAYLKDVDFFFKEIKFEFTIEDIKSNTLPSGELFYKASVRRDITGTTSEGKTIHNTLPRFIEVNYDPEEKDLRIVSMYTHEFNEAEALVNWWKDLSHEWKTILAPKTLLEASLNDSLSLADIKNSVAMEELDLSHNTFVQDLEPLARLHNLKILNLSGANVNSLTAIRNLTELVALNISNTKITDLSPLKYAGKMERLNINHTSITDISVISKMPALQFLEMNHTGVADFTPLADHIALQKLDLERTKVANLVPFENLQQLVELNISGTEVSDLSSLKNLNKLVILDLDSTQITNLTALGGLGNLKILRINFTSVSDLLPLQKLTQLEKVYADHTSLTREAADNFALAHPKVLVVFESGDLNPWWDALAIEWKTVLSETAGIPLTPSKEELVKVPLLDSINLSNRHVSDLEALRKLLKLRVVIARGTTIHDLSPLKDHTEIKYLDISETEVSDISLLAQFTKLKVLRADKSKIEKIEQYKFPGLEKLYADETQVHDITAREFLEMNPNCLLIFKTIHLNRWWASLDENWKEAFKTQVGSGNPSRESLHKLVEQNIFRFKDVAVHDLSGLSEFVRLEELYFSGTAITTIPLLENIKSLKALQAANGPLRQTEALAQLTKLEDLDISNTPIEDIKVIASLYHLKKLNCAGTQIKRLDPLEGLEDITFLDCSNTNVTKLDALENLSLKTLKCYNTKVSNRVIENYKSKHPNCNVVYYR